MYDPEFALKVEETLREQVRATNEIIQELGEDHPFAKICQFIDDSLEYLAQESEDYDNCFDEREKSKKKIKIVRLIKEIEHSCKQVEEILNES